MVRTLLFLLTVGAASTTSACISASQEPIAYDAVAVGQAGGAIAVLRGWTVTVSSAQIALGPFYFCASESGSSTLCGSAVAELQSVAFVDALAPSTSIGQVRGYTGPIKSASYDFGISWFDTETAATPAPQLPAGHSLHLEGKAVNGAQAVTFVADVDVVPQFQGQNAVPTEAAVADVQSNATRFEVVLAPATWLQQLDFDAIATKTGSNTFVIAPGMPEHEAILVGLKNLAPIGLRWVSTP